MKNMLTKIRKTSERGQAIIIIAFALVGLVAIVGLMVDGGMTLIEYARLKRGIDSASVAAASQFRKGFVGADLEKAGKEFLKLNQSDAAVAIYTCNYPSTNWDATLCSPVGQPQRKLVRVTANRHVDFAFMRIVGINGTTISASSVGEAASIDMVLALDTSSSMAYETTGDVLDPNYATKCPDLDCVNPDISDPPTPGHPNGDDPKKCNLILNGAGECEPLATVKDAAINLVDQLFFPYDRVALVAFTGQETTPPGTSGTATRKPTLVPLGTSFMDNDNSGVANTEIQTAISTLKVFQPRDCPNNPPSNPFPGSDLTFPGPCLLYDAGDGHYIGQPCIPSDRGEGDPTSCGASNIGGAMWMAGDQFANARPDSFWAVIALIGGPPNAAVLGDRALTVPGQSAHLGFCPGTSLTSPGTTWDLPGGFGYCRDLDPMPASYNPATYNPVTYDWSNYDWKTATRHKRNADGTYPANYDSDDYLRDAADYIAAPSPNGQGAILYTICMGRPCRNYGNTNDPASAELLGRYMAYSAGNQYDALGNVTVNANHGLYFYSNNAAGLAAIFGSIADNIFTRIAK